MSIQSDTLRDFALDPRSYVLLATLQSQLVHEDTNSTQNPQRKYKKFAWHRRWEAIVDKGLREAIPNDLEELLDYFLREQSKLLPLLEEAEKNRTQSGLILLELAAFTPYFPIVKGQGRRLKGLSVDPGVRTEFLRRTSVDLGFSPDKARDLDEALKKTTNSRTKKWWKIGFLGLAGLAAGALTLGMAAPFVAGLVGGAMGLSGAAATAAGLAAIGGGSIAAGGLGMAGGTAILVGGGTLLGLGGGVVGGYVLNGLTSHGVLLQAVKLEVALKEVILQGQYDTAKLQEVLLQQRRSIERLERQVDALRTAGEEDRKRIGDLEKAVKIMREALKRNQVIVREAAA